MVKNKDNKIKSKNMFKNKTLMILVIILLIVVVVASGFFLYIGRYRNAFALVKGTKIYNNELYYETVKQAERLNFLGYDPLSSDPKTENARKIIIDYAKEKIIAERLYYLMGVEDGFVASEEEVKSAFEEFKNSVTENSEDPEKDFQDELKFRDLTERMLKNILKEEIIADKEKDKLTESIDVSENDVKEYFVEWGSGYGANGKNDDEIYKEKYGKIKQDALNMKKGDYLDVYSKKLVESNKDYIFMDNVYKKFMRWFYEDFLGLSVPDQYKAESL